MCVLGGGGGNRGLISFMLIVALCGKFSANFFVLQFNSKQKGIFYL